MSTRWARHRGLISSLFAVIGFWLLGPLEARGDLCNPEWFNQLETDITTPAPFVNNVDSGYSEFLFLLDPRVKLVLRGSFPKVRFLSFETYDASARFSSIGALFDYQIVMDRGSTNPYVPGAPVNASPRDYTLEILPQHATASAPNTLRMSTALLQAFIVRFYSPDESVTLTPRNLPRVYAVHASTGQPAPCPIFVQAPVSPGKPSEQPPPPPGNVVTFFTRQASGVPGSNSAIPAYLGASVDMNPGQVAVIKFKAPGFVDTHSGTGTFPDGMDTRYWSLCQVDPTDNFTVGGLPDYLAVPDANGYVTVVFGTSTEVQQQADAWGQSFVLDQRSPTADWAIFVYRNLLPSSSFWSDPNQYPVDYYPFGLICEQSEYLAGKCNP